MFLDIFVPVFDNASDQNDQTTDKTTEDKTEDKSSANKMFTQEQVNQFLAAEKRKTQGAYEKRIAQLESLRDSANLTQQQVEELNKQIEDMQTEFKTKEQLAQEQKTKMEKDYQTKLSAAEESAKTWQTKFSNMVIKNSIISAASDNEAFSADQIFAILNPVTRLVEVKVDGKKTGDFETRVKFTGTDEEGKPVELDLTPSEAVKRMSGMEKYANLFKSNLKGGLGDFTVNNPSANNNTLKDTNAYMAARKAGKLPTSKKG